jgi:hypothetical protein
MARHSTIVLAAVLALLSALGAQAQGEPLAWEVVGEPLQARALFVEGDSAVYTTGGNELHVTQPPFDAWLFVATDVATTHIYASSSGHLYNFGTPLFRSTDRGHTWSPALVDGSRLVYSDSGTGTVIELPPGAPGGPALLAEREGDGLARSTDDGQTWAFVDTTNAVWRDLFERGFAYAPATAQRPAGTVVAVGLGGAAYSRDGGRSWRGSNLLGLFGYRGYHAAYSAHHDAFFALVNGQPPDEGIPTGMMWASADGQTWALQGRVPTGGDETPGQFVVTADGVLWAIIPGDIDGEVFSSADGGRTWVSRGAVVGEDLVGNEIRVNQLAVGPAGRLWLATTGVVRGAGAVVRTVEPVVVASEEVLPGKPDETVALGTPYPNPSEASVTVPVVLAEAAEVRVVVYDVLGRAVATLHDGPLAAGRHPLTVETTGLTAGVYFVKLRAGSVSAARALAVLR